MPQLAEVPTGKELEDFVAALLECTGHFVEKNIEEPSVLELDIVATTYGEDGSTRRLFEVKEGSAQFSDIFKVLGWMTYLGIDRGAFVTGRPPEHQDVEFFASRCEQVGITFLLIEDRATAPTVFEEAGFGAADAQAHALWRFSMWVERNLMTGLRRFARDHPNMQAPREALNYYRLINNGIFMTRDAIDRINRLYEAYQAHPRLTASAAHELAGGGYDPETTETSPTQMRQALYDGRHVLLQACMYLEHRARLSLLKAAVDYLAEGGHIRERADGTIRIDFRIAALPQTFLQGLSRINAQEHYQRYPLFWQTFLWGWGGLIVTDRQEDDYAGLSEQTGIPTGDIPTALSAFDWLFPTGSSWLHTISTAAYSVIGMVPWPFQGLGAWQRLVRSGQDDYAELGLTGQYTVSDLAARHNKFVSLLEGDLVF